MSIEKYDQKQTKLRGLIEASKNCDDKKLRSILETESLDLLDSRDINGRSLLHYTAEHETPSCAELLLRKRPELLTVVDDDGYSILHLVSVSGNTVILNFLLSVAREILSPDSFQSFIDAYDNENHTGLHWAVVCGEISCLVLLLAAGANPSLPDIHGAHPIHYAAQLDVGHKDSEKSLRIISEILNCAPHEKDARDKDGRTPLLWAASSANVDAIICLVNLKSDVSKQDSDGLTALHCAASRGFLTCLEVLIEECSAELDQLDSNGSSALFYAVTLGHADCTRYLLKMGSAPNRQDRKGRSPVHCGSAKGQLETLKIMSQYGANFWIRNMRGDLPIHDAVRSGRKELVIWLLNHVNSRSIDFSNNMGKTPLHVAVLDNNIEMCKVLMDWGLEVNPLMRAKGSQILTPLDAALLKGYRETAKFLLLNGALPASKLSLRYDSDLNGSLNGSDPLNNHHQHNTNHHMNQKGNEPFESGSTQASDHSSQFSSYLKEVRIPSRQNFSTQRHPNSARVMSSSTISQTVQVFVPDIIKSSRVESSPSLNNSSIRTETACTTSDRLNHSAIITNIYVNTLDPNQERLSRGMRHQQQNYGARQTVVRRVCKNRMSRGRFPAAAPSRNQTLNKDRMMRDDGIMSQDYDEMNPELSEDNLNDHLKGNHKKDFDIFIPDHAKEELNGDVDDDQNITELIPSEERSISHRDPSKSTHSKTSDVMSGDEMTPAIPIRVGRRASVAQTTGLNNPVIIFAEVHIPDMSVVNSERSDYVPSGAKDGSHHEAPGDQEVSYDSHQKNKDDQDNDNTSIKSNFDEDEDEKTDVPDDILGEISTHDDPVVSKSEHHEPIVVESSQPIVTRPTSPMPSFVNPPAGVEEKTPVSQHEEQPPEGSVPPEPTHVEPTPKTEDFDPGAEIKTQDAMIESQKDEPQPETDVKEVKDEEQKDASQVERETEDGLKDDVPQETPDIPEEDIILTDNVIQMTESINGIIKGEGDDPVENEGIPEKNRRLKRDAAYAKEAENRAYTADTAYEIPSIDSDNSLRDSVSVGDNHEDGTRDHNIRSKGTLSKTKGGPDMRAATTFEMRNNNGHHNNVDGDNDGMNGDNILMVNDDNGSRGGSRCTHKLHYRPCPSSLQPLDLGSVRAKVDSRLTHKAQKSYNQQVMRREAERKVHQYPVDYDDVDHDDYDNLTVKVTKSLRKYQIERKLFEELQELKRYQIRSDRSHEQLMVKRLIEKFEKDLNFPGINRYEGNYDYKSYERFLYDQLRKLSKSNRKKVSPVLKKYSSDENLSGSLENDENYGDRTYSAENLNVTCKCQHNYVNRFLPLDDDKFTLNEERDDGDDDYDDHEDHFASGRESRLTSRGVQTVDGYYPDDPYPFNHRQQSYHRTSSDVVKMHESLDYEIITRSSSVQKFRHPSSDSRHPLTSDEKNYHRSSSKGLLPAVSSAQIKTSSKMTIPIMTTVNNTSRGISKFDQTRVMNSNHANVSRGTKTNLKRQKMGIPPKKKLTISAEEIQKRWEKIKEEERKKAAATIDNQSSGKGLIRSSSIPNMNHDPVVIMYEINNNQKTMRKKDNHFKKSHKRTSSDPSS